MIKQNAFDNLHLPDFIHMRKIHSNAIFTKHCLTLGSLLSSNSNLLPHLKTLNP